jgi:hypothetical protein
MCLCFFLLPAERHYNLPGKTNFDIILFFQRCGQLLAVCFTYRDTGFADGNLLPFHLVNFCKSNNVGTMDPDKLLWWQKLHGFLESKAGQQVLVF